MTELIRREKLALNAIKQIFNTDLGEDSINLFIEHHLNELPQDYWNKYLNLDFPKKEDLIKLLQFKSSWGDKDMEYFDFSFPDDVTDYVMSVHFNNHGQIDSISMES